ncbi:MAG: bi-domain-containing oxidoreductase [Actinomycetota bacterium]
MKQLLQDLRSGDLVLEDVPVPLAGPHEVVIRAHRSLISAGTERMLTEFASGGYLSKARQQPDRVREVIDKVRTDGLATTFEAVQSRLDTRIPMGYCSAGEVIAVGTQVAEFAIGDRVISNGPHAEVVAVSKNLVARIPDRVSYDDAVYTVAAAIALQGIRLAEPTLGERVAVIGLGLVGLLAVQLLRANGCRVIGFDYAADRVALADAFGAEAHDLSLGQDPVALAQAFTDGEGIDAVLVTASTKSDEVIHQSAQMSRQRGRLVLTGVVGLDLKRADFYEKELDFTVSCSYGPGRYDPDYEERGVDYPIGFVRWTEQRNFVAVLDLIADGSLRTEALTGRTIDFDGVQDAYRALQDGNDIGIVLRYDTETPVEVLRQERTVAIATRPPQDGPVLGVIGAGSFANGVLLPSLTETGVRIKAIASRGGTSASATARRFGVETSTTDGQMLFADPEVTALVVTTRHDAHAPMVVQALQAGKDVFVEKPLAIDRDGLAAVRSAYADARDRRGVDPLVMVGFNRRFAPTTQAATAHLASRVGPCAGVFFANAGAIPADHWVQDPAVGGGRLIGEACHYIDLLRYLVGSPISSVAATAADTPTNDIASISLTFVDGSVGTVHYFANGPQSLAKERVEVLFDGKSLQIDNFRSLRGHGVKTARRLGERQRKGHAEQFAAFVDALRTGAPSPIPFDQLVNVTEATIAAVESIEGGANVELTTAG